MNQEEQVRKLFEDLYNKMSRGGMICNAKVGKAGAYTDLTIEDLPLQLNGERAKFEAAMDQVITLGYQSLLPKSLIKELNALDQWLRYPLNEVYGKIETPMGRFVKTSLNNGEVESDYQKLRKELYGDTERADQILKGIDKAKNDQEIAKIKTKADKVRHGRFGVYYQKRDAVFNHYDEIVAEVQKQHKVIITKVYEVKSGKLEEDFSDYDREQIEKTLEKLAESIPSKDKLYKQFNCELIAFPAPKLAIEMNFEEMVDKEASEKAKIAAEERIQAGMDVLNKTISGVIEESYNIAGSLIDSLQKTMNASGGEVNRDTLKSIKAFIENIQDVNILEDKKLSSMVSAWKQVIDNRKIVSPEQVQTMLKNQKQFTDKMKKEIVKESFGESAMMLELF